MWKVNKSINSSVTGNGGSEKHIKKLPDDIIRQIQNVTGEMRLNELFRLLEINNTTC